MVAERNDVREQLISSVIWRLLLPYILMFPVLAGLVRLAIGWGLSPLQQSGCGIGLRVEVRFPLIRNS